MKRQYIDAFLIPLPKSKLGKYKKIASKAAQIWLKHGALDYVETVGDEVNVAHMRSFAKAADCKKNETVVFSWIAYKSKAHRNQVNKKVMADPYLATMEPKNNPFDYTKMCYGGFKVLLQKNLNLKGN